MEALKAELTFRAKQYPWTGKHVETIFFGGGTPSLFAPSSLGQVIEAAEKLFGIEDNAELTVEANPGTVDKDKLIGYRRVGINRISFGAQSFSPKLLKFLGRIHDAEQTRRSVAMAFEAGFERVNLDLIFAIPGQTLRELETDLEEAVALRPEHISCYNLTFEPGTSFYRRLKRGQIRELSDETQARMYAMVRGFLPSHGYPMYELSNYAPLGHECKHNLTYWRRQAYLGVGAGAHSFFDDPEGGQRWWNENSPRVYMQLALRGAGAERGRERLDRLTAQREFVFLNLRLIEGFALDDFRRRFDADFFDVFGDQVSRLLESKLLLLRDGRLRLSERGLELADSVIAEFF